MATAPLPAALTGWFSRRGWAVREHQLAMVAAYRKGQHALLTAPTGAGKTLAGFLPSLAELIERPGCAGLHTLYVSPLKALGVDVQRNLAAPIADLGLPIRVETRSGDTPANRKARQRRDPPHILLTTPESLHLLLSFPESAALFADLRRVVIDEVHAFAPSKRGDLLALALARLQRIAPAMRRAALSATLAEPQAYARWLAPQGRAETVRIIIGAEGAAPDIRIMLPTGPDGEPLRIPWAGHAGSYAIPQVMAQIARHKMTLIFTNTRFLAELLFQQLWDANEAHWPIGIHHGSLSVEARRKVENAMASGQMRALVCTASLDLGIDWGDIDCVIQMGAPKGSSRLLQRIGRANHRLDQPSKAFLVPGNRFEFLEAQAALDAVAEGQRDGDNFRPGGRDVLAQHVMAMACAAPFHEDALFEEVTAAPPYADLMREEWQRVLAFTQNGGYALRAYDRFQRLRRSSGGIWQLAHPRFAQSHRLNAGIIVDAAMIAVRFANGRSLGKVEESFAAQLSVGDRFFFAGTSLEVVRLEATDLIVRASKKAAMIPSYNGLRLPLTTHLAARVQAFLTDRAGWGRFPDDVREWLEMQDYRSRLPAPGELLVETFPYADRHYLAVYSFAGWNAHQSLGMLLTRRMESMGLMPIGFVANDYALAVWSLQPVDDPAPLFSTDILTQEFVEWVEGSHLLKRAFREVAVISGLIERQHPGKRKTGRQVTFSTDLIYDVLRKFEPDHLLIAAAWADARARMTDVERLADLLAGAQARLVHQRLDRVSPLAVPLLVMIGREHVAQGATDDALLLEAEALADAAMRPDA